MLRIKVSVLSIYIIVVRFYNFIGASKSSQHLNTVWTNWKRLETLNKTFSGTTCKTWTDLSTSEMHHLKTTFPDFMTSDDMYNFCQDPDSSGVLWCYIPGSGSFLWEPCFIQGEFCIYSSLSIAE